MTKKEKRIITITLVISLVLSSVFWISGLNLLGSGISKFAEAVGNSEYADGVIYRQSENAIYYFVYSVNSDDCNGNAVRIATSVGDLPVISFRDGIKIIGNGETSLYFLIRF